MTDSNSVPFAAAAAIVDQPIGQDNKQTTVRPLATELTQTVRKALLGVLNSHSGDATMEDCLELGATFDVHPDVLRHTAQAIVSFAVHNAQTYIRVIGTADGQEDGLDVSLWAPPRRWTDGTIVLTATSQFIASDAGHILYEQTIKKTVPLHCPATDQKVHTQSASQTVVHVCSAPNWTKPVDTGMLQALRAIVAGPALLNPAMIDRFIQIMDPASTSAAGKPEYRPSNELVSRFCRYLRRRLDAASAEAKASAYVDIWVGAPHLEPVHLQLKAQAVACEPIQKCTQLEPKELAPCAECRLRTQPMVSCPCGKAQFCLICRRNKLFGAHRPCFREPLPLFC